MNVAIVATETGSELTEYKNKCFTIHEVQCHDNLIKGFDFETYLFSNI